MNVRQGYKQTDIGLIPNDWNLKKFGDILNVIGGGAFKSSDSCVSGIKWLKIANVGINHAIWDSESYLPFKLVRDNENFLLKNGDYVIALTRPILDRKLKIARLGNDDVPALLNQRVGKIEIKQNNNIDFIYYLFQKYETINGLLESMAGTDPPNLSNGGIYNIDCAVPINKSEQTAIATALSDADALISSLEKLIEKKRAIKQGAMQELLKPKEGWIIKKLGKVAEFYSGGTPSTSNASFYGGDICWITSSDLNKTNIESVEGKITKSGLENSSSKMIQKETLLVALYGATAGVTAISHIEAAINQAVLAIIPKNDNNLFLFYQLTSLKDWILSTFIQGGQGNLSGNIFKELELYLPLYEEQTRIATILSDMDAEIITLEQKLSKYKSIKQGMMQELLTGKIRLV
ncbi:MAG: restriction endonuclease subunit S [Bacteroidota bacterium]